MGRSELVKEYAFGEPCHGAQIENDQCRPFYCSPEYLVEVGEDVEYLGITWATSSPKRLSRLVVEEVEGWASLKLRKNDEVVELNGKPTFAMSPMTFNELVNVRPLLLKVRHRTPYGERTDSSNRNGSSWFIWWIPCLGAILVAVFVACVVRVCRQMKSNRSRPAPLIREDSFSL